MNPNTKNILVEGDIIAVAILKDCDVRDEEVLEIKIFNGEQEIMLHDLTAKIVLKESK